jgi:hypothetical protein
MKSDLSNSDDTDQTVWLQARYEAHASRSREVDELAERLRNTKIRVDHEDVDMKCLT